MFRPSHDRHGAAALERRDSRQLRQLPNATDRRLRVPLDDRAHSIHVHRAVDGTGDRPTTRPIDHCRAWRGGGRQALLARLLVGCDVEALDDHQARSVGELAARETTDIVAATAVEGALRRHDLVVSSDPQDLQAIAESAGRRIDGERP